MSYAIRCQAKDKNGKDLFLTDAFPGGVTVTNIPDKKFEKNQLWQTIWTPVNKEYGGIILKNSATGRLIAVPRGDNPALTVPDTPENRVHLDWPSPVLQFKSVNPTGYFVIRGLKDQDNNLNVKGNAPYSNGDEVLFWSWDGGGSNEIWAFFYNQD